MADKSPSVAKRMGQAIAEGADGSVVVLLQLMAIGADANHLAADFKRGNKAGAPEGNDQFALPVFYGASGLAARVRLELQQSKRSVDRISQTPHDVEVRSRAGELTFDDEIIDPQQIVSGPLSQDDTVGSHCPAPCLPAGSLRRAASSRASICCSTS